jgi:hypothetical protein
LFTLGSKCWLGGHVVIAKHLPVSSSLCLSKPLGHGLSGKQLSSSFIEKPLGHWQKLFASQVALHLLRLGLKAQSSSGPGPFFTHFPFSKCSSGLHTGGGGGGHPTKSGVFLQTSSGGRQGLSFDSIQIGLHAGSFGVLSQSIIGVAVSGTHLPFFK